MRGIFDIPFLTAGIEGTGGTLKGELKDFVVEERALYEPSGEGEHVYLYVEKRGVSTFEVAKRLAGIAGVPERSVGYAGLKDVKAVARQWFSLQLVDERLFAGLEEERFRVVEVARHVNKLRTGHLKGNYFRVRVRGAAAGAVERAREVLNILEARGVPNFYGPQRFGSNGRNMLFGRALLRERYHRAIQAMFARCEAEAGTGVCEGRGFAWEGDYNRSLKLFPRSFVPERSIAIGMRDAGARVWGKRMSKKEYLRVIRRVPKRYLEFYVSALQAYLFNEVLKKRYMELDKVMEGDLAYIHGKGAVFLVEDAEVESERARRLEISPSGPIFGYKVKYAEGTPGEMEWEVLRKAHLTPRRFRMRMGLKNKGVRRPMRVPLTEVTLSAEEDGFTAGFFLPKGSYATTVLREVIKPDGWEGLV